MELKNNIKADIKEGNYQGQNIEIDIGETPEETKVYLNGELATNIKSVNLIINTSDQKNNLYLETYADLDTEKDVEKNYDKR